MGSPRRLPKLMTRSWHGSARPARLLNVYIIICVYRVYRALVQSTLLYGLETWTASRPHLKKLEQLQMPHSKDLWKDKISNTETLHRFNITSVGSIIIASQLRWSGHVTRMGDVYPQGSPLWTAGRGGSSVPEWSVQAVKRRPQSNTEGVQHQSCYTGAWDCERF